MAELSGTLSDVGTGYPRLSDEFLAKQTPTPNPFRNADDYLAGNGMGNNDYITATGDYDVVGGQSVFMMTSATKSEAVGAGAQPHGGTHFTFNTLEFNESPENELRETRKRKKASTTAGAASKTTSKKAKATIKTTSKNKKDQLAEGSGSTAKSEKALKKAKTVKPNKKSSGK